MNAGSSACTPRPRRRRLAYFGLFALQHRGQESAGIATGEGGTSPRACLGLVSQVFDEQDCRRWTATWRSATSATRPPAAALGERPARLARRRARARARPQRQPDQRGRAPRRAADEGLELRGTSDSEIIAALLSARRRGTMDRGRRRRGHAPARGRLLDGRDDQARGRRIPRSERGAALALGKLKARTDSECFVVASESCAFDIIGAQLIREVQPGEMVSLTRTDSR